MTEISKRQIQVQNQVQDKLQTEDLQNQGLIFIRSGCVTVSLCPVDLCRSTLFSAVLTSVTKDRDQGTSRTVEISPIWTRRLKRYAMLRRPASRLSVSFSFSFSVSVSVSLCLSIAFHSLPASISTSLQTMRPSKVPRQLLTYLAFHLMVRRE